MATAGMSTAELETLFLQKLTEKYELTERSIKKAFSRFDADGNGLLNLNELVSGFESFLNGVSRKQVQELVFSYDVNGDGVISFEEFFHFLTNRQGGKSGGSKSRSSGGRSGGNCSVRGGGVSSHGQQREAPRQRQRIPAGRNKAQERMQMLQPASSSRRQDNNTMHDYEYEPSEQSIPDDISSVPDDYMEQNSEMSEYSYSQSDDTRSELSSVFDPTIGSAVESRVKIFTDALKAHLFQEAMKMRRDNKIANSHQVTFHNLSDTVSRNLLERAFQRESNRTGGRDDELVNLKSFCNVLKSFSLPGLPNTRMEVFKHLFSQCTSHSEPSLADPTALIELLFGQDPVIDRTQVRHIDRKVRKTSMMGQGPVKDRTGGGEGLPNEVAPIPTRYTCSKSRTTYFTPSNFDEGVMKASAAPPACEVTRDHVFGLRLGEMYSGQALYCLHGGGQGSREKDAGHVIVYGASSLGVVHDLVSNTQLFFDKHDDELTCITVDPSCNYVLSGQLGKRPSLYLWDAHTAEFVKEIGKGFFARAVCAATFSHDTAYVYAAGCDDKHSLGIWDVHTGVLVCETTLCNGIPPQIRSLVAAPDLQYTTYINSKHDGLNDCFVTSGERHLKIWSFKRPSKGSPGVLAFKGTSMGMQKRAQLSKAKAAGGGSTPVVGTKANVSVDQAKVYWCSSFILRSGRDSETRGSQQYDVVSGGDNGYLYLWVEGVCFKTVRASRGAIRCIKVVGENIFCGCMEGNVKMFDSNLTRMADYNAISDIDGPISARPSTPSSISSGGNLKKGGVVNARAQSARRVSRTMQQASSAAGGTKPRASTPKRAIGRVENRPGSSATTTHSQSTSNAVLTLDMDFNAFFYSGGGRGGQSGETLVVATAAGNCMRLHIDAPTETPPSDLFTFHTGSLWALAPTGSLGTLFLTGGEDRFLCIWSLDSRTLICRRRLQSSPRCSAFDKSNKFIAVGMSRGLVALHYFDYKGENSKKKKGPLSTISDVLASRHDCAEAISDVKFSPSSDRLAVGSHDNFIDVYDILLTVPRTSSESPAARIHPHKRIRGHSSYITHLDWSLDGRLVQSTCGAYEILYWDAESGKQFAAPNPSDLKWKTYTCILGFGVMGIWPPFADGTDINSLHVSRDKSLVVTGDDSGLVNVFNYPCVVKNAPRQSFTGHSSHVTNVRFAYDDSMIVSVGGHDNCAICWVVTKKKLRNPLPPDSGWV